VSVNRVLKRTFGPKRDEVTGGWRTFPPKYNWMIWARDVARMENRGIHIVYWWESQNEMRPLGRPIRRWVDNIKMDLGEIRWFDMD
jgi:hypothetical protein